MCLCKKVNNQYLANGLNQGKVVQQLTKAKYVKSVPTQAVIKKPFISQSNLSKYPVMR